MGQFSYLISFIFVPAFPLFFMRLRSSCVSLPALFPLSLNICWLLLVVAPAGSRANHAALPLCHHEQQQQQCPGFVTLLRNSTTGVLTMAPNTSVTTIDPTENFLFGVCGDGVAIYTLDSMQRAR